MEELGREQERNEGGVSKREKMVKTRIKRVVTVNVGIRVNVLQVWKYIDFYFIYHIPQSFAGFITKRRQ